MKLDIRERKDQLLKLQLQVCHTDIQVFFSAHQLSSRKFNVILLSTRPLLQ